MSPTYWSFMACLAWWRGGQGRRNNLIWVYPRSGFCGAPARPLAAPLTSLFTDEYRLAVDLLIGARKRAGITQQQLAAKLGRPQSFVSKY